MVARVKVDADYLGDEIRIAMNTLKEIEPKLLSSLKRDLKSSLQPYAAKTAGAFPSEAPLSGMNGRGRTRYVQPKASVSLTPGVARRGKVTSLLSIKLKTDDRAAGAWLAEMAGMRGKVRFTGFSREFRRLGTAARYRLAGQGGHMINNLNKKFPSKGNGGRFGWQYFSSVKDDIQRLGKDKIENFIEAFNRSKA